MTPDPCADPHCRPRSQSGSQQASPDTAADRTLGRLLDEGTSTAAGIGGGHHRLWRSLVSATEGGKRFRPALLEVGYRAWGGTDDDAAAAVGAAIELLHTAFVVHDDVIDGDDVRRGRLNVSGAHVAEALAEGASPARARSYGTAAGILAGDLALAGALRAVALCPAEPGTVRRLLDLFDQVLHATAAGELSDVRMSLGTRPDTENPTVAEALLMAERKTGEYSFALPLQAAGILAGASAHAVHVAGRVGRALGTAYQLTDDLQGVFGDPARTGKSATSDLRSGKSTPLIAHARTTAAWPTIAPYVGLDTLTEADAEVVRELLTTAGSRRFVEELVSTHVDLAEKTARGGDLPADLVTWIAAMRTDLLSGAP